ncbi:transposase [Streptomyces sp. MCAF7]
MVTFAALDCIPCPFKQQCTTAKKNRRQLSLQPREMTEALRQARDQQQTKDWNTDYAPTRWRRGNHPAGRRRHRPAPRPLPRPGENPP